MDERIIGMYKIIKELALINGCITYSMINIQQTLTDLFVKVHQHDALLEVFKYNQPGLDI